MIIEKQESTIRFSQGEAYIDLNIDYELSTYRMYHGNNDNNVTFNGAADTIKEDTDRAKCVLAALKYVKTELENKN